MDRFSELRAFATVVEAGGFSAAAREMGQSRSAVNRLVIALEERLGVQLLHRTTRTVTATSTGRALYDRARQVLDDLDELEASAATARDAPIGKLRISLPPTAGMPDFSQMVIQFMKRYPKVEMDATYDTRLVDPIAEGYDLVVRVAPPDEQTQLVDHRFFVFKYILCACREYLDARGQPTSLKDLRDHAILYQGSSLAKPTWTLEGPHGPESIAVHPILATNSISTLLAAVRDGLGITIVPAHEVRDALNDGRMQRVLPEYSTTSRVLQVIYPPSRHLSERVRLFTAFVGEMCDEIGE